MKRRGLLYGLAGIGLGSAGFAVASGDFAVPSGDDVERAPDGTPLTQRFGGRSAGFEAVTFEKDETRSRFPWVATISFGDHDMSGFGLRHVSKDRYGKDVYVCRAPAPNSEKTLPIQELLHRHDGGLSSRRFKLFAYRGGFRGCSTQPPLQSADSFEELGSVTVTVPAFETPE